MRITMNVDFATHVDEIEFEPFLGKRAKAYQKAFEKWYYEEVVADIGGKQFIVMQQRSTLPYTCFDVNVIFDWMKEVSPDSNPRLIKEFMGRKEHNRKLPSMCF